MGKYQSKYLIDNTHNITGRKHTAFDAVVCVTKALKFVLCLAKSLPFIYFVTYQQPRHQILSTVTVKDVYLTSWLEMQKYQNVAFASKPDFLLKYFENSDFRPCIKCFNTHAEDLKPKETRF